MSLFDQYLSSRETSKKTLTEKKTKTSFKDDRFWKPTYHKDTGTGYAVIRFLPGLNPAELPYVTIHNHYFKGSTGVVYWESNLNTIGKKDPVSELNSKLWNSGIDELKKKSSLQKRKTSFISNIQVIKDPDHPENEGKVFLYQYGKTIFDCWDSALHPKFEDEKSFNAFDILEGANLKIKITETEYGNKTKGQSYESSAFDMTSQGPLAPTREEMEAIFNSQYDLQEFVDPTKFKSYEELSKNLYDAVGMDYPEFLGGGSPLTARAQAPAQSAAPANPNTTSKMSPEDFVAAAAVGAVVGVAASTPVVSDSDDEDLAAYFDSLSED